MIYSPDAAFQIDPTLSKNLFAYLPPDIIETVKIVPISFFPNFTFKPPQVEKYVLVDFTEGGCDTEEYQKFWAWVEANPPILTFRRELKAADAGPRMLPIEFVCYLPVPVAESKEAFDSRPLQVFYWWGFSHPSRPKLHARIVEAMNEGIEVLTHFEQWPSPSTHPKKWASIHIPHWVRRQIIELTPWMNRSKITVALPGNGLKTFRSSECINTIMAMWKDGLLYSFPWTSENSIQLEPHNEFEGLLEATNRSDLYDIYLAGMANLRHYYAPTYATEYIAAEVRKVL